MTLEIISEWLENFDKKVAKQGKHILLLINDRAAHDTNTQLKNITLRRFPPNALDKNAIFRYEHNKMHQGKYRMKIIHRLLLNAEGLFYDMKSKLNFLNKSILK